MTDATEAAARVRAFCDQWTASPMLTEIDRVAGFSLHITDLRAILAAHDAQAAEIARLRAALRRLYAAVPAEPAAVLSATTSTIGNEIRRLRCARVAQCVAPCAAGSGAIERGARWGSGNPLGSYPRDRPFDPGLRNHHC